MIRINLLPEQLESRSTQINPALPLTLSVLIPLVILAPIHMRQQSVKKRLKAETASLKSDLERYQPIIAQVEALEAAKVQLTQRKSVIQQLENERLRYPQFFDDFIKLLPGNLWLTNLATVIQPTSGDITLNMDVVALDNYAIADLVANLETSQIFSDVDLGALSMTQSANSPTISFRLTTIYRKTGTLTDANKKS